MYWQPKRQCHDCIGHQNEHYKDGYCIFHWKYHFAGLTNRERMAVKKQLREGRKLEHVS